MTHLYLAGPMSGYPEHNRPAFAASAERLSGHGFFVLNPGTLNGDCSYREALAVDLGWIIAHAEIVAFQEGWEASNGAKAEHALAEALLHDKHKPVSIWYLPVGFAEGRSGVIKCRTLKGTSTMHMPGVDSHAVEVAAGSARVSFRPRPDDDGLEGIGARTPPAEWG